MLLFFSSKSWILRGSVCLIFFSCGVSHEIRIDKLWKFLAADPSQQVGIYYHVENNGQLQLRFDNLSEHALVVDYRLRVFDSRPKKIYYETPAQRIALPVKLKSGEYQSLTIDLSRIKSVQSIEMIEFIVSDNTN